jgi:MarR family transcriptional regulator, lower aerobic nicotinate degradation pathway regulator
MTASSPDDLAILYTRPGFLLRRAHQISAAVFENESKGVGLTPAQFGVLTVLRASPGIDQSSLVRRSAAPESRRNLAVVLSPAGEKLLKKAQKPAELAFHRLMSPLSAEQQLQLVALLQQLTEGLEGHARAAFIPEGGPPEHG